MKNIECRKNGLNHLFLMIVVLLMSACAKDFVCECVWEENGEEKTYIYEYYETERSQAQEECNAQNIIYDEYTEKGKCDLSKNTDE